MNEKQKAHLIKTRFIARTDLYAVQWWSEKRQDGGYVPIVEGTCPNTPPCPKTKCTHVQRVPLRPHHIAEHLAGKETVGVYQLNEEGKVKWLCLDIDGLKGSEATLPDLQATTKALARTLQAHDVPFLVETSGGRGYHLWVFFDGEVDAAKAMQLGKYIRSCVEPLRGVGIEVYPKQVAGETSLGNLVKLPLGVHQRTGNRCLFLSPKFEPLPDQWAALSDVRLYEESELDVFIAEHEIPQEVRTVGGSGERKGALPCFIAMMEQGHSAGVRDTATFKLACYLRDRGLPYSMALAAMDEWNDRCERPLNDSYLTSKISSAYSTDYSPFPCNEPMLDHFCDPTCRFFEEKMRNRKKK